MWSFQSKLRTKRTNFIWGLQERYKSHINKLARPLTYSSGRKRSSRKPSEKAHGYLQSATNYSMDDTADIRPSSCTCPLTGPHETASRPARVPNAPRTPSSQQVRSVHLHTEREGLYKDGSSGRHRSQPQGSTTADRRPWRYITQLLVRFWLGFLFLDCVIFVSAGMDLLLLYMYWFCCFWMFS